MAPSVPFVDLRAQYRDIQYEVSDAIARVLADTAFINGPFVEEFEERFAWYVDAHYCVGCANGTDALEIVLKALGIGAGDEVLVPANTFIATSEAVTATGAIPVFVDSLPGRYTIDPDHAASKITSRTKAIIPVHLYGLPAEMDEIMELARRHSLAVVEDCAHAHGARYKGRRIGTFGDAATFSFFPENNLGAYGDAGAITTNNKELADLCRMTANHGRSGKNDHVLEGRNSRLDGVQAAILTVKLRHIENWTELRVQHSRAYSELLAKTPLSLPEVPAYSDHVYNLYVVRTYSRTELQTHLKSLGVETEVHYPTPLPFLRAYKRFNYQPPDFPVAHRQMSTLLSLPMFPEMSDEQVHTVTAAIERFFVENSEEVEL